MGEENLTENSTNWIATKKFFSEAILVAFLTAVGYLAAFAYQYSYLSYFGVPVFFVDVNLVLVLFTTSIGLIWFMGLGTALDFLLNWIPQKNFFKFLKTLGFLIVIIVGLLFPMIASIYDPNHVLLSNLGLLVIVIVLIVGTFRLYKNPELFTFKKNKKDKNDLLTRAEQIYGSFPVLFVVTLTIFVLYSYIMGTTIAKNQPDYLVSNTDPALVIIATYNGNFIGLTFNPNTRSFDKNITLLSQDKVSNSGIIFNSKKIGPLRPTEEIK